MRYSYFHLFVFCMRYSYIHSYIWDIHSFIHMRYSYIHIFISLLYLHFYFISCWCDFYQIPSSVYFLINLLILIGGSRGVWREVARLVARPCRRRRPSSLDDGGWDLWVVFVHHLWTTIHILTHHGLEAIFRPECTIDHPLTCPLGFLGLHAKELRQTRLVQCGTQAFVMEISFITDR